MALLMKRSSENLPNTIDDVVNQMVFGNLRRPPGDQNTPYQKLLQKKEDVELPGIWAPENSLCKAMALKWFFPTISGPFRLPEEQPIPPYYIVGYDAFKTKEVMELSEKYPGALMKYGIFSSDVLGNAELISKTAEKFEKITPLTYDEKIVLQLAKSDVWLPDFLELGPSYMSPDTVQGAEDATLFFPPDYDIPDDVILETKKKRKKRKGKAAKAQEDQISIADKEASTEPVGESEINEERTGDASVNEKESIDEKGDENSDEEGEEEDEEDAVEETDKATSISEDRELEKQE